MARTKKLTYYPKEYWDIVREVGSELKRVDIVVASVREGNQFRGQFYGFVQALRAAEAELKMEHEVRADNNKLPPINALLIQGAALSAVADAILVTLGTIEGQITVTFQRREESWQSKLLRSRKVTDSETKERIETIGLATQDSFLARLQREGLLEDPTKEKTSKEKAMDETLASYGARRR